MNSPTAEVTSCELHEDQAPGHLHQPSRPRCQPAGTGDRRPLHAQSRCGDDIRRRPHAVPDNPPGGIQERGKFEHAWRASRGRWRLDSLLTPPSDGRTALSTTGPSGRERRASISAPGPSGPTSVIR
jgi:hypothetical protein